MLVGTCPGQNLELVGAMTRAKYANAGVCKWAQALTTQTGCVVYFASGVACVVLNQQGAMSVASVWDWMT